MVDKTKEKKEEQTAFGKALDNAMDAAAEFLVGTRNIGQYHDNMRPENLEDTVTKRSNPKQKKQ